MPIQNDTAGKNSTDTFAEAMCLPRENTLTESSVLKRENFAFNRNILCVQNVQQRKQWCQQSVELKNPAIPSAKDHAPPYAASKNHHSINKDKD